MECWRRPAGSAGVSPAGRGAEARRKALVSWQARNVEVSLDTVEQVGRFVELELLARAEEMEAAKACIAALAERLGLVHSERRSYLELLWGESGARLAIGPPRSISGSPAGRGTTIVFRYDMQRGSSSARADAQALMSRKMREPYTIKV